MVETEPTIDTNLYSRQIHTFGMETMGKLIKLNVLIVGLRGLGVETAKNLILAGPASVTLHDPTVVQWGDLSSNFYLQETDVGNTTRAQASISKLQELNPYVKVRVADTLTLEDHANFSVVVYTELLQDYQQLININDFVRAKGIGFITSLTLGPSGYAFLDYGDSFQIFDADGEETKSFILANVTQANPAIVTVHEDKRHKFQDGDYVRFTEVEGMTELNTLPPTEIQVIDGFSFKLKVDATGFGAYQRQGLVENVKVPKTTSYHSLRQSLQDPVASSQYGMLETPDLRNFGRSDQLHLSLHAVLEFHLQTGRFPQNNDQDFNEVLNNAKKINEQHKESGSGLVLEEIEEKVVRNVSSFAAHQVSPLAAFFGGIVAQEIVKFTGKYSPLKQWLHYDIFETLPAGEVDRTPQNSRYDDQIAIYGREIQEKLLNVRTFLVGAGALGCEYIKAFALMGIGCGPNGQVSCTDNDNIEVSNLNRQFLFRKNNVGTSKSKTACEIAKSMNQQLNVYDYQTRVGSDTEAVFNDKFWDSLDFVVNAVDNIKARLYVDQRCVWYTKPLLESGTLGTKANSQMIIPFKTQCYGDSQDPPEEAIPMCTLRNFPNQIEHCIEWGRDLFNKLFFDAPNDAISYIEKPQGFVAQLKTNTTISGVRSTIQEVKKIIDLKKSADFGKCIEIARLQYEDLFNYQIANLVHMFPQDHLDKDGQPFWSGPKRCPSPSPFNPEDQLHALFVAAAANLVAFNLGLPQNRDSNWIAHEAAKVTVPPFEFKTIKVELPGQQNQNQEQQPAQPSENMFEDEQVLAELLSNLKVEDIGITPQDLNVVEFEKDDDTNFHIDFIHAAANLRARNYKIHEIEHQKTKFIAGKIIPAIATTTAMITGAVSAEIYKFVQGIDNFELYKNGFINLALPLFVFSEPTPANKIKSKDYDPILMGKVIAIPNEYTIYDKIVIDGPLTIGQLQEQLKEKFQVDITLVSAGQSVLFNGYLPGGKHNERKLRIIEELYRDVAQDQIPEGRSYLTLEVGGEYIPEGCDFQMPTIKYNFKH